MSDLGPEDDPNRAENTVWWITSIAVSVVCCSVLFILFASYLVDIKDDIKDTTMRIHTIEEREDRILADVEIMSRRAAQAAVQNATGSILPTPSPVVPNAPPIGAPDTGVPAPVPALMAPAPDPNVMSPQNPGSSVAPEATPSTPNVSVPTIPVTPEKP